ncbi:RadC family protein [Inhella proteolytica]|uniref:DNA repair protein RadC n=1 Tax=Inhella proteolytica TaxID=2795029 RepID=A0A931J8G2_9BURK|nr:DNA repair protein RadC [Inhella proteolytica]MBH9578712.1 DNA repair protein RadC [Inhella proteolytica]
MSLAALPPSCRPREKLLERGPAALSDAELLALLLRTGVAGQSVLSLSDALLQRFGGLAGLLRAEPAELARIKGLGPAKRAELLAVLELARRVLQQPLEQRPVLSDADTVEQLLRLRLAPLPYEVFAVLFLDSQLRLIALEELFRGTLNHTAVYPRELAQRALQLGAAAVILAHNHPSGLSEPSQTDRELTLRLSQALSLFDIRVLDHLVVGHQACVSFAARGWL